MAQPLNKKKSKVLTLEQRNTLDKHLVALADAMSSRTSIIEKLGKSYGQASVKRDLYKALGYESEPTFTSYYARYKRQDIAKPIVNALPDACWRLVPEIADAEKDESPFEDALRDIINTANAWHYFARADRISGIGQYGCLLLGFADGGDLAQPLQNGKELLYLRPYMQIHANVKEFVEEAKDKRYGLPLFYELSVKTGDKEDKMKVHYSRIIHICENATDDDLVGTPRLESVLNRLQDLELISGGSSEMFWRGAFPGFAFKAETDAQFDSEALTDLDDEIQEYLQELRRYIRLQGIDVQPLSPQVSDPTNHIEMLLTLISAATRIPKRILLGSERGELASSQDERAWLDRIDERRQSHCEPVIIRPFVDTLIAANIIPPPPSGSYAVEWPPLVVMGDSERAEIASKVTDALSKYVATPGLSSIVPPELYLSKYLEFSQEEINQAKALLGAEFEEVLGTEDVDVSDHSDEGVPEDVPIDEEV